MMANTAPTKMKCSITSMFVVAQTCQLKFIIEAIGELDLEETLETRVMERMDNYRSKVCVVR